EYNCAFGDRVYFTCKAEILQIANEALRENMQTFQICDACRIEHHISDKSVQKIKEHFDKE
ncbi:MAG: hypothetical protein IJ939_01135, partial [Clostridia bacterium]|nr:hypothetical protein [Clostridia bacterium]